jgi:hypothetical protein
LQGDWLCPSCTAGEPPPLQQSQAVTLRQKLLGRAAGLAVVRIKALHQRLSSSGHQKRKGRATGECEFSFTGRWYCLPEETRRGRQASSCTSTVKRVAQQATRHRCVGAGIRALTELMYSSPRSISLAPIAT